MNSLLFTESEKVKLEEYKAYFKSLNITHSFPRKEHYVDIIGRYRDVIDFPWRDDQYKVIEEFLKYKEKIYVVHAVFGSGKTTLLLGMLIYGVIHRLFLPSKVMFVSFNISIKNEIKRKLTYYGMSSKVVVRTFDSIIYEICKHTGYPHLDLPNFEGKRKHVYTKTFEEECDYEFGYQPDIIFIDECQDLEKNTMDVFKRFFPKSKFVLAGDIFQSIQKEPRESVLWHYMNKDEEGLYKIYMSETPRVPKKNLDTLKKALSTYYPEFKDKISKWTSSNTTSTADVEWRSLENYNQMFEELEEFCEEHTAEESMILTFSSAITVKGAMGDIARFRRFLSMKNINVNKNHKKMEVNDYFLTTANSSKGLERDYVIAFLTFPLEKAFINLSDDIVVNLITVALTRAKKKVIMYVPKYEDKFSRVLSLFDACPKPCLKKIRADDKSLTEFRPLDYLKLEHTVTELIRQSIIKYDTRIKLRENIKIFKTEKLFEEKIHIYLGIQTEEEKAFVGVLIENLITSTWVSRWPMISSRHVDKNPMYNHCIKKIKSLEIKYKACCARNISDIYYQFEGIFAYSQLQMALTNKILFTMTEDNKEKLMRYWMNLKPLTMGLKPTGGDVKIQSNLKMPLLTGVADAIVTNRVEVRENVERDEVTVIEIKASMDFEWKDDALVQAMCYCLMTGKSWSRIVLLNPFMNEKISYYFNTKKILTLRDYLFSDIMTFNINCLLAKMTNVLTSKPKLRVENCVFIDVSRDDEDEINQVSVVRMVSPIKTEVLLNKYVTKENTSNFKDPDRSVRSQYESEYTLDELKKDIGDIVENPLYNAEKELMVYCREEIPFVDKERQIIIEVEEEIYDEDDKEQTEMRKIELRDSLGKNMIFLSKVFSMYSFY